jgi:hypothetical protein
MLKFEYRKDFQSEGAEGPGVHSIYSLDYRRMTMMLLVPVTVPQETILKRENLSGKNSFP